MLTIPWRRRSGRLTDAMRSKRRRISPAVILGLLVGAAPLAAQKTPDYSGFSASRCIPFANSHQAKPFTEAPQLRISVAGSRVKTVTMDTGSVGIALAYDQIPNFQKLKSDPAARPGHQFLSSRKVLWKGTWVPVTVSFYTGSTAVATARVPVLGVERWVVCKDYRGNGTCGKTKLRTAAGRNISYLGVGFGQERDYQPQGTPDKNPLLNLIAIGEKPVAVGAMNQGYIIGTTGVTVGLTPANTSGFDFIKLSPDTQRRGDWMAASMCVKVNDSQCFSGTVLVDTGIPHSYITVPLAARFATSKTARGIGVLAPGSKMAVYLPGMTDSVAVSSFQLDSNVPAEPLYVIPWRSDKMPTFVNTGRHFLRAYQFLYDARNGYVGFMKQVGGCGGPLNRPKPLSTE